MHASARYCDLSACPYTAALTSGPTLHSSSGWEEIQIFLRIYAIFPVNIISRQRVARKTRNMLIRTIHTLDE